MAKMTKKEQIIKGLIAKGAKPVACKSKKYEAFFQDKRYYFVGKHGSLRHCEQNTPSYSMASCHLNYFLEAGKQAGKQAESIDDYNDGSGQCPLNLLGF